MSNRLSRETLLLLVGIGLPAFVVGFFLLATLLPSLLSEPPRYDLIFSASTSLHPDGRPFGFDFTVVEGSLRARVVKRPAGVHLRTALLIYEQTSSSVREIPLYLPDAPHTSDPEAVIAIPEMSGRRIITALEAPDGYRLRGPESRGAGLLGDLFGMRRRHRHGIVRSGVSIPIEIPPGYYGFNFLGWISRKAGD